MKRLLIFILPAMILASCGQESTKSPAEQLVALKKQRAEIDAQIATMEAKSGTKVAKVTPVTVMDLQTTVFKGVIEVQSAIASDENVLAAPQAPAMVRSILVQTGQHVSRGQLLATLDVSAIEQQIESMMPNLQLLKTLFEKQQRLYAQNIGSEVQLMSAKTNYESMEKNLSALKAQRDLYRIVAPISGTIDEVSLKVGDFAQPGGGMTQAGIRIVNFDKLKAEASVGENYLGKIKVGDAVRLVFPSQNDSIKAAVSYVTQSVNPMSRSFMVQVKLPNSNKLHPNMSCIMQIINYTNPNALVVPVSVIQKTSEGSMVYVAENNVAKAIPVTVGRNANGWVEILSGLNAGDKIITAGYEEMENGQSIAIQ